MTTFLALLSALAAVALLWVLAHFAGRIADTLEAIGAREPSDSNHGGEPPSYLARIAFGVRAIETEVGALPPQATELNAKLEQLAEALKALEGTVGGALAAVEKQEG